MYECVIFIQMIGNLITRKSESASPNTFARCNIVFCMCFTVNILRAKVM